MFRKQVSYSIYDTQNGSGSVSLFLLLCFWKRLYFGTLWLWNALELVPVLQICGRIHQWSHLVPGFLLWEVFLTTNSISLLIMGLLDFLFLLGLLVVCRSPTMCPFHVCCLICWQAVVHSIPFFFFKAYLFWEREIVWVWVGEGQRERLSLWGSTLLAWSLMWGSHPPTMRSWPEWKSTDGHLTDSATQAPP